MLRLTSRRADRVQRDPRRAFARLRDQVSTADWTRACSRPATTLHSWS